MKVYLIVLQDNKEQVFEASLDQFKAQKLCHILAKATKKAMSVVTENYHDLSWTTRVQLRKTYPTFNKEVKNALNP